MAQQQVRAAVTAFSSNWKTRLQHNAMTAKGRYRLFAKDYFRRKLPAFKDRDAAFFWGA
jgi:hypothetical protein